jgi:hypothetical protein
MNAQNTKRIFAPAIRVEREKPFFAPGSAASQRLSRLLKKDFRSLFSRRRFRFVLASIRVAVIRDFFNSLLDATPLVDRI